MYKAKQNFAFVGKTYFVMCTPSKEVTDNVQS